MNWAAEHEVPVAQKVSHDHVQYAKGTEAEHCGNCKNFIREAGERPRCRTVKSPIAADMWCIRFEAKESK